MEETNQEYILDQFEEGQVKAMLEFLQSPGSELVHKVLRDKLDRLKKDYWEIDLTGDDTKIRASYLKGVATGLEFLSTLGSALEEEIEGRKETDLQKSK